MTDADGRFRTALAALPAGYTVGHHEGRPYGLTVKASVDRCRLWLYAEELGGPDFVSANVFFLGDGRLLLKPCEMPEEKVVDFVLGFRSRT
ncbi:hypothetical protein [Jiella avicenniae]|uniref:Uncharacterized protein n=1 Tax=Jiella avicenniae TaxID=2907202 RepID=A0A9X1NXI4_9HYPH|nr:hypothetical protein [Jiella avicenniae]MCE7026738.1 hypothetical protein [Jiella avicenniae]